MPLHVPSEFHGSVAHDGKVTDQVLKVPTLKDGEVLVKMICSGVCHTDLHTMKGDFKGFQKDAVVVGHEGVGRVVLHGPGVTETDMPLGTRVGLPWMHKSCGNCDECRSGWETLCGQMGCTGCSEDGTLAEYAKFPAAFLAPIPDGLSDEQAAPILCAGVTTYKALKESAVRPGQWIAITGAGGGLGHLAVQYAKAMGMRVCGLDGGSAKMKFLHSLGCDACVDFTQSADVGEEIRKATGGGAHGVILLAAVSKSFTQAIDYLRPRATAVCVSLPTGNFGVPHTSIVLKCVNFKGSYVGTRLDMAEAMQFAADGKVKCQVEVREGLDHLPKIFEEMEAGKINGRIVIKIGSCDGASPN
uniref:alcohol dehydrogenase n=1 Tax=Chromera velia CCMP2878 TaxID=1169474 RepID=A0A0G4FLP2_9ALVE|mmetsp:Transcript_16222/g.32861  ORF Transcript_16222/g.32861 Transcript_16222/m.32861 type:complete len:358 (-) Transcript_16222:1107-2180(-)|eukprot:Cvel_17560.t1-p1 / transcript=Cvel_17560.t1 / gene=Cvel_17560 / organism=Chromera_velia_CCMP2878 / gene_product=Alcohol dehydrogenase 1, putative / transcript_product=Alcohol dehydrogenase 1, putative / location=Cvel_scaffold1410:18176-21203(+) / protein_length=357 / sequence_SO=supercontig / SO=protein_coding / is_pseudo=false